MGAYRGLAAAVSLFMLVAAASAELPDGLVFDDGYTFFQLETIVDFQDGKPVVKG